jgi:hypothetical protein
MRQTILRLMYDWGRLAGKNLKVLDTELPEGPAKEAAWTLGVVLHARVKDWALKAKEKYYAEKPLRGAWADSGRAGHIVPTSNGFPVGWTLKGLDDMKDLEKVYLEARRLMSALDEQNNLVRIALKRARETPPEDSEPLDLDEEEFDSEI